MKCNKPPKPFYIDDIGTQQWIGYAKCGEFQNLGTPDYKYIIKDLQSLKNASGTGIYPNNRSVYEEKGYSDYVAAKKLKGDKWDYVNSEDYQANFYKWATVSEEPGVKLYYTAYALDKAGNYKYAIKAYYACLVFFPKSVGYTQLKTPWYVAPACIDRIKYLTKEHPELGVKLDSASIIIKNKFDNNKNNDKFYINPGKLIPARAKDFERKYIDLSKVGVKKVTGTGKVKLIQYNNNNFQLIVDDKPYVVRAICYSPNKVGLSPDDGTLDVSRDWSVADYNNNGIIDGPYEAWVDANRNNRQDSNGKPVGDFALMKEMGINTLRLYHYSGINKQLLKDGYDNYGFMYMIGNFLGMYGVDSGAEWFSGTDYTDPKQKENMINSVRKMVEEYKNEPYVLMWVLGNENNYGTVAGVEDKSVGTSNQAQKQPDAYYKFVNDCAKLIKSLDPQQRPVAICNGDVYLLNYCAKNAPDLDIYGANAYRGEHGFGLLWQDVMNEYGKPVVITEYGCPAYAEGWSVANIEVGQAKYHKGCWNDIEDNLAGVDGGVGNALGGVIFEWTDEWWKSGSSPEFHTEAPQWNGPFLDGKAYEEWFGICSLGDGKDSPFKRQLRSVFFMYKTLWDKYKN
jgi:beta-glucuronidase